jgi:hypothetical protein
VPSSNRAIVAWFTSIAAAIFTWTTPRFLTRLATGAPQPRQERARYLLGLIARRFG